MIIQEMKYRRDSRQRAVPFYFRASIAQKNLRQKGCGSQVSVVREQELTLRRLESPLIESQSVARSRANSDRGNGSVWATPVIGYEAWTTNY